MILNKIEDEIGVYKTRNEKFKNRMNLIEYRWEITIKHELKKMR